MKATVERKNGRVLLILTPRTHIPYLIHKTLEENRFHNAYTAKYWEWRGPDTDKAETVANQIAEHYNQSKQLLRARTHG